MELFTCKASADGLDLAVALIAPVSSPKGIVQIVHGMCEHKERYFPFMEFLAAKGYVAVAHDLRGHGASVKRPEDLGYFYDGGWTACVNDVKEVGDVVRERYPDLPFTLFGHSMGSMVVRCYAKRYDYSLDSLIVCGCPSDNPAKDFGAMLALFIGIVRGWHYRSKFLQKLSFGAYNKPFAPNRTSFDWLSVNEENVDRYIADPYCGGNTSVGLFYDMLGGIGFICKQSNVNKMNLNTPILFISGDHDPVGDMGKGVKAAYESFRTAGVKDVELKLYPGLRHEILNEKCRDEVYADLWAWIEKHL